MKPANESIYFRTAAAQIVESALDRCAREEIITVIVAAPGRGKSECARRWSVANERKHPHVRVVCTVRNSPRAMLNAIAGGLGLVSAQRISADRSCLAIAQRLAADPTMLLLDEADMLPLRCLEALRGIWDEASELRGHNGVRGFPLALCGTERLRSMMMREDLERLHRRVGEFEELPGLKLEECRVILKKKWAELSIEDEALAEIHRLSRGSFGWLNCIMNVAVDLAAKDGGGVVNHRVLQSAKHYLVGLPE